MDARWTLLAAVAALGSFVLLARAAEPSYPRVFSDASAQEASATARLAKLTPSWVARARTVQVDVTELRSRLADGSANVALRLFDDVKFSMVVEHRDAAGPDTSIAVGRLEGITFGSAYLVIHKGVVVAAVNAPGVGSFDIRPLAGDLYVIRQLGTLAAGEHCGANLLPTADQNPARQGRGSGADPPEGGGCSTSITTHYGYPCNDGTLIDILVVYTQDAVDGAGDVAALEALITLATAITNTVMMNSEIEPRVRIVHTEMVDYDESGQFMIDLPALTEPADGILDGVHALRDQYGADLVSLWVDSLDVGGAAFQLVALFPEDDGRFGFSVCRQDHGTTALFAHELGHNFGCQHDRDNAANDGFYNYSYGYREPGGAWKTVMAYGPEEPIDYYSNPDVDYTGPLGNPGPTGIPGDDPDESCNNALTISNTAFTVANFRPPVPESMPPPRLYVRANAPVGGNGTSWATAFNDLHDAICVAVGSNDVVDEVWVAAGTYKPDRGLGNRLISFRLANGVAIYGGFAGTETLLSQRNPNVNVTILSGDIGVVGDVSDNTYHVLTGSDLDSTAVLDGFTVTGGNANSGSFPHHAGGGMRNACGSPTLVNCAFSSNRAEFGGAVENYVGSNPSFVNCTFASNIATNASGAMNNNASSPSLSGCSFTGNTAGASGAIGNAFGSNAVLTGCMFTNNTAMGNPFSTAGAIGNYESSPMLTGCEFTSNSCVWGGGAIENGGPEGGPGSSPTLIDCTFTGNSATFGAGVYNYHESSPVISGCTFTGNMADDSAAIYSLGGTQTITDCMFIGNTVTGVVAGVDNIGADAVITGCTFSMNTSGMSASFTGAGAALRNADGSQALISDCTFSQNTSGCCGGAVANDGSEARFRRCTFIGNEASYGGAVWNLNGATDLFVNSAFYGNIAYFYGGAMHSSGGATPLIVNGLFSGNSSSNEFFGAGGAMWNTEGSAPALVNCTLTGNSVIGTAGGIYDDASGSVLTNCIVWGNSDSAGMTQSSQIFAGNGGTPVVNRSIVQGLTGSLGGEGNLGSNPLFIDANGADNAFGTLDDNPRLLAPSPALDRGNNTAVPPDTADVDADGNTTEPTPRDLPGSVRFLDAPATADAGIGTPPFVDLGAYEFVPSIPGDFNADGDVDLPDHANFGACISGPAGVIGPGCSPGNFNADTDIDLPDIAAFQRAFTGGT